MVKITTERFYQKFWSRTTDEVARVELRITHHLRQLVVFVRHMWIACANAGAVSTKKMSLPQCHAEMQKKVTPDSECHDFSSLMIPYIQNYVCVVLPCFTHKIPTMSSEFCASFRVVPFSAFHQCLHHLIQRPETNNSRS